MVLESVIGGCYTVDHHKENYTGWLSIPARRKAMTMIFMYPRVLHERARQSRVPVESGPRVGQDGMSLSGRFESMVWVGDND
jgi:hypothetical protein